MARRRRLARPPTRLARSCSATRAGFMARCSTCRHAVGHALSPPSAARKAAVRPAPWWCGDRTPRGRPAPPAARIPAPPAPSAIAAAAPAQHEALPRRRRGGVQGEATLAWSTCSVASRCSAASARSCVLRTCSAGARSEHATLAAASWPTVVSCKAGAGEAAAIRASCAARSRAASAASARACACRRAVMSRARASGVPAESAARSEGRPTVLWVSRWRRVRDARITRTDGDCSGAPRARSSAQAAAAIAALAPGTACAAAAPAAARMQWQ